MGIPGTNDLVQVWVTIGDSADRSHLESRWVSPAVAAQLHATHPAHGTHSAA